MTRVQDHYIVVDSMDRDISKYPNPADYVINPINPLKSMDTVEVMMLQLTRGEANVHSGNNTFSINLNNNPQSTEILIPEAEYTTLTNLASAIETAVKAKPGFSDFTVTVSVTNPTRLTITHASQTFTVTVTEGSGRLLGITCSTKERGAGTKTATLNQSGSYSVTGNRAANLYGEPYISLYINDFERMNGCGSTIDGSYITIPLEKRSYMERFLLPNDEKEKKGLYLLKGSQRNITQIRIRFTRPDGSLYDFNGVDHQIVLRFTRQENKDYSS